MRKLKFRAWDKDRKYFVKNPEDWQIRDLNDDRDLLWTQYISREDKNGKEIYAGDIIRCKATRILATEFEMYEVEDQSPYGYFPFNIDKCFQDVEVIGNKYEKT